MVYRKPDPMCILILFCGYNHQPGSLITIGQIPLVVNVWYVYIDLVGY